MPSFSDRLEKAIKDKNSVLCVGIDPQARYLPPYLLKAAFEETKDPIKAMGKSFSEFGKKIIDAVAPYAVVVKPQAGFYEQYGSAGYEALEETIKYAKEKGLIVLTDAKRGDGSDTAIAYASAHLGEIDVLDVGSAESLDTRVAESGVKTSISQAAGAIKANIALKKISPPLATDAITIHAWAGTACVEPFVEAAKANDHGVIVFCKSSFEPNSEVENLVSQNKRPVWEEMAEMIKKWSKDFNGENGYSNVGVVVGATYPEEAKKMREILPKAWFLVPGFGAQGGGATGAVMGADENGLGIIVNSSRGVIFAYNKEPEKYPEGKGFEKAAEAAAAQARDELNQALKS